MEKAIHVYQQNIGMDLHYCFSVLIILFAFLQQKLTDVRLKHIVDQNGIMKKLKKKGTDIVYLRAPLNTDHN